MIRRAILAATALAAAATPAAAQSHGVAEANAYALIELPALALAVIFGFLTARALRGGRLGEGMGLIAWGFLVMAIGHLHMQGEVLFGFNLFGALFGRDLGQAVWVVALLVTWTLTGFGFYRLYRASSSI
ncbi:MAG TPA: hypothetical protein VFZ18_12400 [Longimicrobiaceae bacterium]